MAKGYFISGTDTGVGKTLVASILVNKFDAIYYKPIQCGVDKFGNKEWKGVISAIIYSVLIELNIGIQGIHRNPAT